MKDLMKMKAKFEREFEMAKIENEMEERFNMHFRVMERLGTTDGLRVIAHCVGAYGLSVDEITMAEAARMLCAFPSDEKQVLNASATSKGDTFGYYHIRTHRGFNAHFTTLSVEWLHGGNSYEFSLQIDGNEKLEGFFRDGVRPMDSAERSTYKPTRRGHLVKSMDLPIKKFNCNCITYSGGYQSATDTDVIDEIIRTIKNGK